MNFLNFTRAYIVTLGSVASFMSEMSSLTNFTDPGVSAALYMSDVEVFKDFLDFFGSWSQLYGGVSGGGKDPWTWL